MSTTTLTEPYIFHQSLTDETTVPPNGILSRTIQTDARSKIILFRFAPGQELSAHAAPFPATLHFLEGEADVLLGEDRKAATAGTFVYMTPKLEHGIKAKTPVLMLLTMIKGEAPVTKKP